LTVIHAGEILSQLEHRIPKTVKGLSIVSLFNDFASEMIYPLLPAFITRTLGASATYLGVLDGAAELTSALVKLASGRLADRPGWKKPLILGGYLSAVLIRPLMAITSAAWQVIGFRVLDRIGKGLRTPPRDSLIAEVTVPEVRGRAYGFHRGADHLGAVFGSLAAWWLLRSNVDVRDVLTWSLLPGVVAFLVLVVVLRSPSLPAAPASEVIPAKPGEAKVFWTPVMVLAALTFFRLPEALLLLRLQDLGVPVVIVPLVWAGLHVVRTAASYPGGWITDRVGPRLTIVAGGIVAAGIALLLGFEISPGLAITGFLGFGLVAGLMESPERVLITRLAPRRTGRAFGAYHAVIGMAALPAGVVFGWMYQHHGGGTALWVSAAAMGVALIAWAAIRIDGGQGK
jgi:MFS family permease